MKPHFFLPNFQLNELKTLIYLSTFLEIEACFEILSNSVRNFRFYCKSFIQLKPLDFSISLWRLFCNPAFPSFIAKCDCKIS